MADEIQGTRTSGNPEEKAQPRRLQSRRRFVVGAASTGVVALTVLGRPAWAGGGCTYSGQLSGNLSRVEEEEFCGGEGRSPGYWMNHPEAWHPDFPPYMGFDEVFGVSAFPGRTMMQVVSGDGGFSALSDGDPKYVNILRQLGMHAAAGLQNSASPVSYDLTVAEVIQTFGQAYYTGDPDQMEITKDSLDYLNSLSG